MGKRRKKRPKKKRGGGTDADADADAADTSRNGDVQAGGGNDDSGDARSVAPVPKALSVVSTLPLVSILVPTYKRKSHMGRLCSYIAAQTYPRDRMEVVFCDESGDGSKDVVLNYKGMPTVRWVDEVRRMRIGAKRQILVNKARGDILVHMDSDDFYVPQRVEAAVAALLTSGRDLAASTVLYVWHLGLQLMTRSGPFGANHGTNATFAYTRRYANRHRFANVNARDEAHFTRLFSEPIAQIHPGDAMLCIAHDGNTVKKKVVGRYLSRYGPEAWVDNARFPKALAYYRGGPDACD
jgi:glycosyltransferase involved in cell wall biosynthesis